MKRFPPLYPLIIVALWSLSTEGVADGYYRDKAQGWFWREALDEGTEAPPNIEATPLQTKPLAPPTTKEAHPQGAPPTLNSAAWFREHLPEIRDRALDDPSLENVMAFYRSQKTLMDKANRFAEVSRTVVMVDPTLDESVRRPLSPFGVKAAEQVAMDTTHSLLQVLSKETAILFFFLSDCQYCELEAPLLHSLESRYGFNIVPVSMDHKPLRSGQFPNFRQDEGQASHLHVQATPALFLIHPQKGVVPIAQGLLSLDELVARILMQGRQIGVISESDLASSRGLRTKEHAFLDIPGHEFNASNK